MIFSPIPAPLFDLVFPPMSVLCSLPGESFRNRTPMAYDLRSRIDEWNLMKLQSFCKAKNTVKKMKWQPTHWERIFTNPTSDRGLVSNIYKELNKLDSRESDNPIKQ